MSQIGWTGEKGKNLLFDEALTLAEKEGSWASVPYEILALIKAQVTKPRTDEISVTQLLGCPRKVYLEGTIDYFVPPLDNWPALRGSLIHSLLEDQGGENTETEVRYERKHRGVTISGQPDSVRVIGKGKKKLLRDWKSTEKIPYYDSAYPSHKQQVSIYRWLLDLDPRFTDIEVVYVSLSGVKAIALKKGGTTTYGRVIQNEVMSDEEVEAFLDDKLMVLDAQRKADRPVSYANVPEEDLWQCSFCPVRPQCYGLAAEEQRAAFLAGDPVTRIPPRERKDTKKK